MKTKQKETTKIITTIIIATIIILNTIYTQAASISVTPKENQYLELRATAFIRKTASKNDTNSVATIYFRLRDGN